MKGRRVWAFVGLIAVCLLVGEALQAKSLSIGSATGTEVTLPITMSTDESVQGFVLSVAVDTSKLAVIDVRAAGATLDGNAELVVPEILPEGFTLGVVMDFEPPYDGQEIPAGDDLLIAEVDLQAQELVPCGQQDEVPVVFQDGLNDPPLSNILVVAGMSISQLEGLELNNGSVTVPGTCDTLRIVSTTGGQGEFEVGVPIEVDNLKPVEGYVLAVKHESGVTLESISTEGTDAEAVGIEFEASKIYSDGGTLGVIFDFDPPYDGQTLPPGKNQTLAVYTYSTEEFECPSRDDTSLSKTFALEFVDGVFGSPPLDNILVEGGFSTFPTKENGTVTFLCKVPVPPSLIDYYIGADTGGEEPEIVCAQGAAGAEAKVTVYYTSAEQPIQGMSMAVKYPTDIQVVDLEPSGQGIVQDKHLEGTLTEGINAEFVSFNADNQAGELIIGILVDSTPPVPINHMYPPRDTPGAVLNIFFAIPEDAECDTQYALQFQDGLTGAGDVPIYNRAAVFNYSVPVNVHAGCLTVGGKAAFIRGDCNTDGWVDIADPAATMSYLFLGVFDPACLDACDSNDDGLVDLADVAATLRFLFELGPTLPDPGPFPPGGYDPTPDAYGLDLGCEAGDPCD